MCLTGVYKRFLTPHYLCRPVTPALSPPAISPSFCRFRMRCRLQGFLGHSGRTDRPSSCVHRLCAAFRHGIPSVLVCLTDSPAGLQGLCLVHLYIRQLAQDLAHSRCPTRVYSLLTTSPLALDSRQTQHKVSVMNVHNTIIQAVDGGSHFEKDDGLWSEGQFI